MGTPMTLPAAVDLRSAPVVTPLLDFLAGLHAPALACIWPSPHAEFLALPAARRHVAAILAGRSTCSAAHLRWMVDRARDGELAAELFGREPPGGLMKALGRMGEVLWTYTDYVRFLDLFGEESACILIRHTKALRAETLSLVALLPPSLRQASILTHLGTDDRAAADLVAAWAIALRLRGAGAAPGLAQRLGRAATAGALFGMARDMIQPLAFGAAGPPPDLPAPFQPVRQLEALNAAALEFRNCLRDFVGDLAAGRMAVYVWRGDGGPAAIALRQDPAGWRLAEARGRDNAELDDGVLGAIAAAVQSAGVRTGESWGWLHRRLEDRACDAPAGSDPVPADGWRLRLGLGNIWD
ncbi:hypothetical protein [Hyphomonas sp.]|uniref:hypothetical protein n=1 Tax=Hyphomonas sp. TaxID=87 RepID=UPI00391CF6E5